MTFRPTGAALLLATSVAGCAMMGGAERDNRGTDPQPYPSNYRTELTAFMRTYLNDPRGIREAALAEPLQRRVTGRSRYVACVRFNARGSDGAYEGVKERAAVYIDGRFDKLVEEPGDLCEGANYSPFPELEKLAR